MTLYDYCISEHRTSLLRQWDGEKNVDLRPGDVSHGSHQKVWWRCEQGHEWQAVVKSRSLGSGCPVCTGRVVLAGINDLASTDPVLAEEWHREKNGSLKPEHVRAGTEKKVWWQCEKGHEWQATVYSRARGAGCPVCAGKIVADGENDLASLFPQLCEEWDSEKNAPLKPEHVTAYSNRRVWWRCSQGHSWQAAVAARSARASNCPYCSGRKVLPGFNDLKSVYPLIATQWNPTRNGSLTPDMVTSGSSKKVWWRCEEGHEWKAVISSRTGARRHGCPFCAGKR